MDAAGVFLLYDEFIRIGELFMNIEKRNLKMFNIITTLVLAAVLLTAFGGFMIQRQTISSKDVSMGFSRSVHPIMQPELAQTGPTGSLVVSTGIVLLMIGFGTLVIALLVRNNVLHRASP